MHFVHRLAAALGGALIGATVLIAPQPSAAAPTATLTNVKPPPILHIETLPPHGSWLRGMLQRNNSCNRVAFQKSPAQIFPPIYRAVQIFVPRPGCLQVIQWAPATVQVPNLAKYVTVQAKNGTFKVPK
jgi:hypothetical protein